MTTTISPSATTKITTHTDLSLLYRVVRTGIRPFRPRLVQLGKPSPSGSPKLPKRPTTIGGVRIEERRHEVFPESASDDVQDNGLWIYDFLPGGLNVSESLQKTKHVIYYFAGGGFQMGPSAEHWKLCARMTKDFHNEAPDKGIRVCLVSYPLAPKCPAVQSLPILQGWLRRMLREAVDKGYQVTLMGDSAGGNVVISLGNWWAQQLKAVSDGQATKIEGKEDKTDSTWVKKAGSEKTLRNVFAMSPPCDLRNENPDIQEADKHDPVLSTSVTDSAAAAWSKGTSTSDPVVSPNLADLTALRESKIKVHGVIGTYDLLAPDALVFKDLCTKNDIAGEWLIWEGQMHCFPLTSCYGLKEGKVGTKWVERVIIENS